MYPRFRGRHKLHRFEDTGLEKCVGCSLCAAACPADCIRVVAAENDPDDRVSAGRALRRDLRDQPRPLHLLRLLRGRVPVRRDHDGPRVRDGRLQPRGPDLHQGDAARGAGRAHAAARGGRVSRAVEADDLRRVLRRRDRRGRRGDRRDRAAQPVLQRARAGRPPGLARGPLPAPLRAVRRGRAGGRLRGRR